MNQLFNENVKTIKYICLVPVFENCFLGERVWFPVFYCSGKHKKHKKHSNKRERMVFMVLSVFSKTVLKNSFQKRGTKQALYAMNS